MESRWTQVPVFFIALMVPAGQPVAPSRGTNSTGSQSLHQAGWVLWSAALSASGRGRLRWSRLPRRKRNKDDMSKRETDQLNLTILLETKHGGTRCRMCSAALSHLSCGFHPLPDAEVAHGPGHQQTQRQVPVQRAHLVDSRRNPQRPSPGEQEKECMMGTLQLVHQMLKSKRENILPEFNDRWGGVWVHRLVDWRVPPLDFLAVFWEKKNTDVDFVCVRINKFPHLCSTCCCRKTKEVPRKTRRTDRKSPRPERWCSRSWAESRSPGCHNQDLQRKFRGVPERPAGIIPSPPHLWRALAFKQGADLPPAGDAALTGVLTERRLQEKDGNATSEEEDQVRNEEGA